MHFKGREARFPMLVWPGIKDFEVRSKRRGREREQNGTDSPELCQGKRKKSKDSRFPHTHIGCEKEKEVNFYNFIIEKESDSSTFTSSDGSEAADRERASSEMKLEIGKAKMHIRQAERKKSPVEPKKERKCVWRR